MSEESDQSEQQGPTFGDVESSGLRWGDLEPQDRPEGIADGPGGARVPLGGLNEPLAVPEAPGTQQQSPLADGLDGSVATTEDLQGDVLDVVEDVMRPLFKRAFERLAQGDQVRWTIATGMIPHPANPGMPLLVPAIYIEMPAALLGQVETQQMILQQFAGWDQDSADEAVRQGLEMCRQQRSARFDQMMGKPTQNGHGGPGSGLILP